MQGCNQISNRIYIWKCPPMEGSSESKGKHWQVAGISYSSWETVQKRIPACLSLAEFLVLGVRIFATLSLVLAINPRAFLVILRGTCTCWYSACLRTACIFEKLQWGLLSSQLGTD